MTNPRAHWLRQNAAARIPRRVICIDSEAKINRTIMTQEHEFRLACMTFDKLNAEGQTEAETWRGDFGSTRALWGYVDSFTSGEHRTVVFMHNAAYDVRLTNALTELPALGWKCQAIMPGSYGFWSRWKRNNRSLWVIDSMSFVPSSLDKISELVQVAKPPLPKDADADSVWLERCRADTEITRQAILRCIRYLRSEDLGDFRVTGAAQGSAAFRHRFLRTKSLLVHGDAEALKAERLAAAAGRAEVWKHGKTSAVLYEYDYEYAYARLAQRLELPTRLISEHGGLPRPRMEKVMAHYAVLANVEVETDWPIVPARLGGRFTWPIGSFNATIWDCELRELWRAGANVTVNRYRFYRRAPLLKSWADWIVSRLESTDGSVDPVVRVMLKAWSRSLIGRFGLRYSALDQIANMPTSDLWGAHSTDVDTGIIGKYYQIGNQLFEQSEQMESENSTPAVMSYIMAAARMQLWEAMNVAGLDNLFYVDTDGIITNARGRRNIEDSLRRGSLSGLRFKTRYHGGDFRAPRNIDLGESRRIAGTPRKAARLEPNVYQGEVWESLTTTLSRRRGDRVFVHERTFNVSESDHRRVHLPGGQTAAIVLPVASEEDSALVA